MQNLITLWKEYIFPRLIIDIAFFFLLLCALGIIVARLSFSLPVVIGMIVNYLILVFAFIINDIEDREDDADCTYQPMSTLDNLRLMIGMQPSQSKTPGVKRFRNIFSNDAVLPETGYLVLTIIAFLVIALSFLAGDLAVVLISIAALIVGFCYSWKGIRLKSLPILDLLSHSFLLAGVQVLYFLVYPGAERSIWGILMFLAVFFNSLSGDLRNEYRDFEEDQRHGIKNTSTYLGKNLTYILSNIVNVVSVLGVVVILIKVIFGSR
jgi:4-hydroxybenzoate polyprenyltransferase